MYINQFKQPIINQQKFCNQTCFRNKSLPSNVKVSVILPIYNQEKYLAKALNSLKNQTLKELEFICVNDGSKDKSLNILKEFREQDNRFKIIDQKNQGCGASRNNGLKQATGEYIAFLDPDDWFEPNALEKLYNKSKKQDCDVMVFNFTNRTENGEFLKIVDFQKRLKKYVSIDENKTFNWKEFKPKVFGGLYPVAWNKLYKHDLIKQNKLHFAKSNLAEDNVFVYGAILTAKKIGYLKDSLYNYVIHEKSAIRTKSDKNFCFFKSLDSVKKMLQNLGLQQELKNEFDSYILRIVSFHMKQIKSLDKFWQTCNKKLTPFQYSMLRERYNANQKLLPIIKSLINKK